MINKEFKFKETSKLMISETDYEFIECIILTDKNEITKIVRNI